MSPTYLSHLITELEKAMDSKCTGISAPKSAEISRIRPIPEWWELVKQFKWEHEKFTKGSVLALHFEGGQKVEFTF